MHTSDAASDWHHTFLQPSRLILFTTHRYTYRHSWLLSGKFSLWLLYIQYPIGVYNFYRMICCLDIMSQDSSSMNIHNTNYI